MAALGPGLLLPLLWIARRDPGAHVLVFPADHFIWEEDRFLQIVRRALAATRAYPENVVLLGMQATAPETEYGWIVPGSAPGGRSAADGLFRVDEFQEKPGPEVAVRLQAAGALWNSFVLAARVAPCLALAEAHLPDAMARLREAAERCGTPSGAKALATAYRRLEPSNFARHVLEPGREALLVQVARGIAWCDWGDPTRILRTVRQFHRRPSWLAALEAA